MGSFFMIDEKPPVMATYVSHFTGNPGGTGPFTFSGLNFGAVDAARLLVLGLTAQEGAGGFSSVTIGGVSATLINRVIGGELWVALVPTGTSGSVVLSGGTVSGPLIVGSLTAVYGANSATPFDHVATTGSTSTSQNITYSANGCIIGFLGKIDASGSDNTGTLSWSGLTKDDQFNASVGGATVVSGCPAHTNISGVAGSLTAGTAQTGLNTGAMPVLLASWAN